MKEVMSEDILMKIFMNKIKKKYVDMHTERHTYN